MEEKVDLRIRKTHAALLKALRELLSEKSFHDISVAELCDRAQVRRATFYKHFGDKSELLAYMIQELQKDYKSKMEADAPRKEEGACLSYICYTLQSFLDFWDENRHMVRTVLNSNARHIVLDILSEQIEMDLRSYFRTLQQNGTELCTSPEMMAVLYSGAAVNCARWWVVKNDRPDKEEVVRQFHALLGKY